MKNYRRWGLGDLRAALNRWSEYHDIVHSHMHSVGSSLDRGTFGRPQDLLPGNVLNLFGEGRHSESYAYGHEMGDNKIRDLIALAENYKHGTSYTAENVAVMPGAWAGLVFSVEQALRVVGKGKFKAKFHTLG